VILATAHPRLDLALHTIEDNTLYALFARGRAGTILINPFLGEQEAGLGTSRTGYLAEVARRHGIRLGWDKSANAAVLDGKLNKASLVSLFSDPDFLGGLRLETRPFMVLLPADRPIPSASDPVAWWPRKWPSQLSSKSFVMAAGELVQPTQLSGKYCENDLPVSLAAQEDGSLLVTYPTLADGSSREPKRLRLIDIGRADRFLVLWETAEGSPAQVRLYYFSLSLAPDGSAWTEPVKPDFNDTSAILDQAKLGILRAAANRHGLEYDGEALSGNLTAARLRALFSDPQFLAGIRPETGVTQEQLEPAIAQDGKMICPGASNSAMVVP
jgi:hypothetical protein